MLPRRTALWSTVGLATLALLTPSAYAETASPSPTLSSPTASPTPIPSTDLDAAKPTASDSAPVSPSAPLSPSSSVTPSVSVSPSPSVPPSTPAGSRSPGQAAPTPQGSPAASRQPFPSTRVRAQAETDAPFTLAISAGGTPQPGRFFEDIGHYAIRGVVAEARAGTKVGIYWYDPALRGWRRSAVATTAADGRYAHNQRVGHAGTIAFRATLGGSPGRTGVASSNQVKVKVLNSYVRQAKLAARVDALKNPVVSGTVYPARGGVSVRIQVLRPDRRYGTTTTVRTNAAGSYRARLGYANGQLRRISVRSAYRAVNRARWELSSASSVQRVRVLNAVVTRTTSAEVARTYRRGCPVGPSRLRTITMNYYGFDKRMHRGVMIVRSNLTGRTTRSFAKALSAGYPMAKMRNPNDYAGNDPRQMAANNTSGFNCRKVVGNPYAQSPHSFGIALDVNPVHNPYRDRNGKWWPGNGRRYIDRTPLKRGMLGSRSALTAQLRREGFFWGGLWRPGRDYQHFEYHG